MRLVRRLFGDSQTLSIVPPTGINARLTVFTAGAMAYLTVFSLALLLATDRLADRWASELAQTATIRISAPPAQLDAQVEAALTVLSQTPGVAAARALQPDEQRALLEPWFGPDLPLESLPVPQLIEITEATSGFDAEGLRLRLRAEVPGAVLDDHTRWRRPLIEAARRLRIFGGLSITLIALSMAALVTLAAGASLSANQQVIKVLRLIGARDLYVVRAFVRRFTLRSFAGAAVGTAAGMASVAVFPEPGSSNTFLTGFGFRGAEWLAPLIIPLMAAFVAYWATRFAAFRKLREIT